MKSLLRAFAFLAGLACLTATATPVSLTNPSFESPGTGCIANGFDTATDVPGWQNTGGAYTNSGVELALQPGAPDGYVNASGYVAFLRGTDDAAYQVIGQTISSGQLYRLSWKAGSISSLAGTTNQQVRLFRTTDNGVTCTPLATSTAVLSTTNLLFET